MLTPIALSSDRLLLRMSDEAALKADLVSPQTLASALSTPVAADWPPRYWDPGAVNWLLAKLAAHPDEPFWRAWFIILRQPSAPGLLIGTAGFKGPPDPQGVVEIGYGIVTSRWRQGFASEAVRTLIAWAKSTGRVKGLCAHTLADDPASGGVLRKTGFAFTARSTDPADGEIDRYERKA